MLPGLVLASLAGIPLGLGAAAGLAVAALAIAAASRQHAVGPDVAVAVAVTTLFGVGRPARPLARGAGAARRAPLRRPARASPPATSSPRRCSPSLDSGRPRRCHRPLALSGFDPQSARPASAPATGPRRWLLLGLLALTTLIAVQALGNLLVVAIVIAPARRRSALCPAPGAAACIAAACAVAAGIAGIYPSYYPTSPRAPRSRSAPSPCFWRRCHSADGPVIAEVSLRWTDAGLGSGCRVLNGLYPRLTGTRSSLSRGWNVPMPTLDRGGAAPDQHLGDGERWPASRLRPLRIEGQASLQLRPGTWSATASMYTAWPCRSEPRSRRSPSPARGGRRGCASAWLPGGKARAVRRNRRGHTRPAKPTACRPRPRSRASCSRSRR